MLPVKGNYIRFKELTSKCPMCEDQLDTQNHLFTCAKYGKELPMDTFFDLSMTEEDCNNLAKRLETREKVCQDLSSPYSECATD